jgi:hypothetical protein
MIISALLGLLTGAALGMRVRIFVLLPAIAVTVASILAIEVATSHTAGRAAISDPPGRIFMRCRHTLCPRICAPAALQDRSQAPARAPQPASH